jgi:LacI family transcriptional regulator
MATIRDIANRAQTSTATVSHVVNSTAYVSPALRKRVLTAIREVGYQPSAIARSLRTKRTKTVGMIIPNISDPFFDTVVRGAEDVLAAAGYTLIIGNSDNDIRKEETYYWTLRAKQVDGMLLITSPAVHLPDYMRRHDPHVTPVVYLDRYLRGMRGDTVLLDDFGGSYQAVSHLLECGYRRIGIITGPRVLLNASARLEGYRRALRDRGELFDEALVREGRFDIVSGEEQAKALCDLRPRPSALFVSNALMTIGVLRAFVKMGLRCPDEMALVSHGDSDLFDILDPSITVVRQPVYDLGETAAQILLKRISRKLTGSFHRTVLKFELVVRGSTRQRASNSRVLSFRSVRS